MRRETELLPGIARLLLDLHFPPSLHGELCEAVGLDPEPAGIGRLPAARRQRDPRMRTRQVFHGEPRPGTWPVNASVGSGR